LLNRLRRLWRGDPSRDESFVQSIKTASMTLPGWREEAAEPDMRVWRDAAGSVLSLTAVGDLSAFSSDLDQVRASSRRLAESRGAGLVEATTGDCASGSYGLTIYKRSQGTGFIFTGMLWMRVGSYWLVWTTVDGERGMTGVREAVVAARLAEAGELTIEQFETSWAADPYEPSYSGVERKVLRYVSDADVYDELFPDHPLSRVRRVLRDLPSSVMADPRQFPAEGERSPC
jgi:hypothetical protein